MMLYHCTWKSRLPSIRQTGLKPNYIPNPWGETPLLRHSKGRLFLCRKEHIAMWMREIAARIQPPEPGDEVVVMEVDVDESETYSLSGYEMTMHRTVPPDRLGQAWNSQEFWELVYQYKFADVPAA